MLTTTEVFWVSPITACHLPASEDEINARKIIKTVTEHFDISESLVEKKCRKYPITWARQLCMSLIRNYTGLSLVKISRMVGARDHTNVIRACVTVRNLTETDSHSRRELAAIEKQIHF